MLGCALERAEPPGTVIHVILESYATHKHPKVGLAGPPPSLDVPFHAVLQFVADVVETVFSAPRRAQRGVFPSIVDL